MTKTPPEEYLCYLCNGPNAFLLCDINNIKDLKKICSKCFAFHENKDINKERIKNIPQELKDMVNENRPPKNTKEISLLINNFEDWCFLYRLTPKILEEQIKLEQENKIKNKELLDNIKKENDKIENELKNNVYYINQLINSQEKKKKRLKELKLKNKENNTYSNKFKKDIKQSKLYAIKNQNYFINIDKIEDKNLDENLKILTDYLNIKKDDINTNDIIDDKVNNNFDSYFIKEFQEEIKEDNIKIDEIKIDEIKEKNQEDNFFSYFDEIQKDNFFKNLIDEILEYEEEENNIIKIDEIKEKNKEEDNNFIKIDEIKVVSYLTEIEKDNIITNFINILESQEDNSIEINKIEENINEIKILIRNEIDLKDFKNNPKSIIFQNEKYKIYINTQDYNEDYKIIYFNKESKDILIDGEKDSFQVLIQKQKENKKVNIKDNKEIIIKEDKEIKMKDNKIVRSDGINFIQSKSKIKSNKTLKKSKKKIVKNNTT